MLFQLTKEEAEALRLQIATSNGDGAAAVVGFQDLCNGAAHHHLSMVEPDGFIAQLLNHAGGVEETQSSFAELRNSCTFTQALSWKAESPRPESRPPGAHRDSCHGYREGEAHSLPVRPRA